MVNEKKRLATVDVMKGIAILCVVFYHLLAPCVIKTVLHHIAEVMLILFFFCSGYFYKIGKRSLRENIAARWKSTMIPFFQYGLLFWLVGSVWLVISDAETVMDAVCCLRNFFGGFIWNRVLQECFGWEYHSLGKNYPFLADFWFLIALLLSSILFFLFADRVLNSWKKSCVCIAACFAATGILKTLNIDLPYNMQIVPFWSGFIFLGALAGQMKLIENPPITGIKGWVIGFLSLAVGVAICMMKTPNSNIFRGSFGGENEVINMLLCITASLFVIFGVIIIFRQTEEIGIRMNEFAWLGKHSLTVYLWHMFFAWLIKMITGFSFIYPKTADSILVFQSMILSFVCLLLTVVCAVIQDKISVKDK